MLKLVGGAFTGEAASDTSFSLASNFFFFFVCANIYYQIVCHTEEQLEKIIIKLSAKRTAQEGPIHSGMQYCYVDILPQPKMNLLIEEGHAKVIY